MTRIDHILLTADATFDLGENLRLALSSVSRIFMDGLVTTQ